MKLLTLNFLTCAVKACKSSPASFPLHPRDAELEIVEADINLAFLQNILPRLMWAELRGMVDEVCFPPSFLLPFPILLLLSRFSHFIPTMLTLPAPQLGLPSLPERAPTREDLIEPGTTPGTEEEEAEEVPSQTARDLHRVLVETTVREGKLVCGNCAHEYKVLEGVPNFLLPGHLV